MSTIPSPAATKWVPVGPGPMPDFRYRGDWAAGNYTDGDIVVYNGVTYLCVAPTTASPTPWAPPSASPSYGTTLPASPADGMEHILVDSISNPTYQWRFRYNAGSTSAYKWEFIGGSPWFTSAGSGDYGLINVAQQWTDQVPTPYPMISNLRAGVYQVAYGCMSGGTNSPANGSSYMGPAVGAVVPTYYTGQQTVQAANDVSLSGSARLTVATAGSDIRCRYWAYAGVGQAGRFMSVIPVQVS
jgi:hypothetical protein